MGSPIYQLRESKDTPVQTVEVLKELNIATNYYVPFVEIFLKSPN